ncbi:MAG: exosortase A [Alphaproteobacteria bacterium]|nr:exosortase A [Alphaproteobacteria bacterium]
MPQEFYLSIRAEIKSFVEDPALTMMGLLPSRVSLAKDASVFAASWRMTWITLAVGIVALLIIFRGTALQIVGIWNGSETYSHGFLILPICAYLIWIKRGALANQVPRPSLFGAIIILAAGLAWLIGELGSVALIQHFSLAIMIQGMFVAILGRAVTKTIIFPLCYLFFAVPFGDFLVPPLQDLTAVFVVEGLQLINIPVFLDGIFLSIPTGNFEVAEACSGVRFLIATIALGFLFSYLTYQSNVRKVGFVALSVAVPIVANGIRAFGIVLIAYYTNNELAVGVDHLVYGWIFFAFVTVVLLLLGMTFRDGIPEDVQADSDSPHQLASRVVPQKRIIISALISLTVGAVFPAYAGVIASRPIPNLPGALPVIETDTVGGWRQVNIASNWTPSYKGAHAYLKKSYRKGGEQVDLFIAYYSTQRQGVELISFHNTVADGEIWQRAASGTAAVVIDGADSRVKRVRMLRRRVGRVAYQWYWVGNTLTHSPYKAKAMQAKQMLIGGSEAGAAIIVSTTYREHQSAADKILKDFLKHLQPVGPILRKYADTK